MSLMRNKGGIGHTKNIEGFLKNCQSLSCQKIHCEGREKEENKRLSVAFRMSGPVTVIRSYNMLNQWDSSSSDFVLPTPGDICQRLEIILIVCTGGLLLASGGQRPRTPPNSLPCPGKPSLKTVFQAKMSVMSR